MQRISSDADYLRNGTIVLGDGHTTVTIAGPPEPLGSRHLDTILTPKDYQQEFGSQATLANGYPWEGVAGRYEVRPWREGSLICVYYSWDRGIAKRTYHAGTWRAWLDALGQPI